MAELVLEVKKYQYKRSVLFCTGNAINGFSYLFISCFGQLVCLSLCQAVHHFIIFNIQKISLFPKTLKHVFGGLGYFLKSGLLPILPFPKMLLKYLDSLLTLVVSTPKQALCLQTKKNEWEKIELKLDTGLDR